MGRRFSLLRADRYEITAIVACSDESCRLLCYGDEVSGANWDLFAIGDYPASTTNDRVSIFNAVVEMIMRFSRRAAR